MSTEVKIKKLNSEVKEIKTDVREMKKFLFAPMKDAEGQYNQHFIKKMLSRAQSQGPFRSFKGKKAFLRDVRRTKK